MSLHVMFRHIVDYVNWSFRLIRTKKMIEASRKSGKSFPLLKLQTWGWKRFDSCWLEDLTPNFKCFKLLQKVKWNIEVKREPDLRLDKLFRKLEFKLRSGLPDGLPPEKFVNHVIEVEKGSTPPHHRSHQLFPVEKKAAKEYLQSLLTKGKIRRSMSPYGAPMFFV